MLGIIFDGGCDKHDKHDKHSKHSTRTQEAQEAVSAVWQSESRRSQSELAASRKDLR